MEPSLKTIRAKITNEEFAALKRKAHVDGCVGCIYILTLIITGWILFLAAQFKDLGVFIFSDFASRFVITLAAIFMVYIGLIICMFEDQFIYFRD